MGTNPTNTMTARFPNHSEAAWDYIICSRWTRFSKPCAGVAPALADRFRSILGRRRIPDRCNALGENATTRPKFPQALSGVVPYAHGIAPADAAFAPVR